MPNPFAIFTMDVKIGEGKMGKILRIIISIVLLLVAGVFLYGYLFRTKSSSIFSDYNSIIVNVKKVQPEQITVSKKYIGNIVPIKSVAVLPFISGFIDKVLVRGGQDVRIGDTLFIIRQAKYKADVDSAYASVLDAKVNFDNAKRFYERMQQAGSKAVSKNDIDNARTAFLSSQANLASAISNYELSRINYDYTVVSSTINGTVGDVSITKGDYVSPEGSPLVKIIQFNPIRVVFSIADKEYMNEMLSAKSKKFFDGWNVKLKLANDNLYNEVGQIKFLDNEVSPLTSSIKVYADFKNPDKILVANSYVDVIMERVIDNAILLPQSAVYFTPTETYVYILKDNKAEKKVVSIGQTINNNFVVDEGLVADDVVVLDTLSEFDLKQNIYAKE